MTNPQDQDLDKPTMKVYALKYGSWERTDLIDIFATQADAERYANFKGLAPDDGCGGWYVEEVVIKVHH